MVASVRLVLRNDECFLYRSFMEWCRENGLSPDSGEPGCATFRAGKVRVDFDGPVRGEDGVNRQSVYVTTDRRDGDVHRLAEVAVALAGRFGGYVEASGEVGAVIDRAAESFSGKSVRPPGP